MRKALIGMRPDRIEDIIALVALYRPGPMENIPTYNARKHGEEEIASIHPKIDHLVAETQGVIVYQEQVMQIAQELVGLFARRSRPAAPRHGQEDPRRDGRSSASASSPARSSDGVSQAAGRLHLRPAGQVRRLRLQQVARRRLCRGLLPDRLSQGALSGRVPRRVDDARHGQHRQARRLPPGCDAARHRGRAAVGADPLPRLRGRREPHLLFAGRASRASATRRSSTSSRSAGEQPFASLDDFCERIDPQHRRQARASKA